MNRRHSYRARYRSYLRSIGPTLGRCHLGSRPYTHSHAKTEYYLRWRPGCLPKRVISLWSLYLSNRAKTATTAAARCINLGYSSISPSGCRPSFSYSSSVRNRLGPNAGSPCSGCRS